MSGEGNAAAAKVEIRRATQDDLDQIARLDAGSLAPPWSAAVYAAELDRGDAFVLVAEGREPPGEVLGFVAAHCATTPAEIVRLVVAPSRRRLGLGRRLVAAAWLRLAARGIDRCWLELREGNSAALRFYRSVGFEVCGRRSSYYPDGEAALLMERSGL